MGATNGPQTMNEITARVMTAGIVSKRRLRTARSDIPIRGSAGNRGSTAMAGRSRAMAPTSVVGAAALETAESGLASVMEERSVMVGGVRSVTWGPVGRWTTVGAGCGSIASSLVAQALSLSGTKNKPTRIRNRPFP